ASAVQISADGAPRALRAVLTHAPADDPPGMDSDHLGAHVRAGRDLAGEGLGGAPNFDAAHDPRVDRGDVVDHETPLAVGGAVAELAGRAQIPAADVDHATFLVDGEADRVVLHRAVGR